MVQGATQPEDVDGAPPVIHRESGRPACDDDLVRDAVEGKVILVTGAAGSIGSELCRHIAACKPRILIGLDQAETPLFHLENNLKAEFPALEFYPELGNITRWDDVDQVMRQYKPSIVFHAAAYKHVPMLERHIFAAVENNIFGTRQAAMASDRHGVERFVMISSDKAVRPTSVMGATKRFAELLLRSLQRGSATRFTAVRFGNVLESSGSVVPIFRSQIASGGPVTVTHPHMRRYFMTAPEASRLLLHCLSIGQGGEIFVFDMGRPVRILDLAHDMIRRAGLRPDVDIAIEITGARPGEKLFEELSLHEDHLVPTSHPKIKRLRLFEPTSSEDMDTTLLALHQALVARDAPALVVQLKQWIPDYSVHDSALEVPPLLEPR